MSYRYYVVFVTAENNEHAHKIGEAILNKKLAACINYVEVTSHYWWENKLHKEPETMLIIKTAKDKFQQLLKTIKENHTYAVPEVIALPIVKGNPKYLVWLCDTIFE
ncbi:MAG: divalent-cation tolerance protein CutA [Planctomycetota bacterium]